MEEAGQRLLGEHDFRNFCKVDQILLLQFPYESKCFNSLIRRFVNHSFPKTIAKIYVTFRACLRILFLNVMNILSWIMFPFDLKIVLTCRDYVQVIACSYLFIHCS